MQTTVRAVTVITLGLGSLAVVLGASEAAARQMCRSIDLAGQNVTYCQAQCETTPPDVWLAGFQPRPQQPPCDRSNGRANCPPPPGPAAAPYKITSCKAKAIPGGCEITVCGPVASVDVLRRAGGAVNGPVIDNRVLAPKPTIGPPQPELLGEPGFGSNAPAGAGSPLAPSTPGATSPQGGVRGGGLH